MAPPPGPQEANPAQRRLRVLNQHLGAARLRAGPDEDQCTGAPSGLRTTEVHRSSCRHEGNCRHGCSCWHEGGATCSRSRQIVPAPTPLALAPAMGRKPAGTPASVKVAATSRSATSAARQPVVVGAMIMDIQARPSLRAGDIVPGTTVPGEVGMSVASHKSRCAAVSHAFTSLSKQSQGQSPCYCSRPSLLQHSGGAPLVQ